MKKPFYLAVLVLALATAYAVAQEPAPTQPTTQQDPMQQQDPTKPTDPMQQPTPTDPNDDANRARVDDDDDDDAKVDDATLQRQLKEQFASERNLRMVQISVNDGEVRLEGTVASKDDRKRAKQLAKGVPGVRKVKEDIEVNKDLVIGGSEEADVEGEASAMKTDRDSQSVAGQSSTTGGVAGTTTTTAPSSATTGTQAGSIAAGTGASTTPSSTGVSGSVQTGTSHSGECVCPPQGSASTTTGVSGSTATGGVAGAATTTTPSTSTSSQQNTAGSIAGSTQTSGSTQTGTSTQSGMSTGASTSDDLKGKIERAVRSEPTLANSNVMVNVTADSIELSGTVPTGKERQTAKRIAQSFAGNLRVVDRLTVSGQGDMNRQQPDNTTNPNQTNPNPNQQSSPDSTGNPPPTC